eukprot:TRINITY_DN10229_c0_g1_i2.p1 TRINITY_DN10229_c0_g1~~TRINITY_DN10229_c0_g1_i2.p1  ORF type:complete len:148 (-),score=10.14 TRINITY_DN10229_c0_g1_i2:84-500(-)
MFNTTIPTRFLVTIGHLIASLMVFHTKADNIEAALPFGHTDQEFDKLDQEVLAILILIMVCFAIDFVGLCGGFSIFSQVVNLVQIVMHFVGAILTSFYVMEVWHARSLWWIWGFTSLIPAVVEVGKIASIFTFKVQRY